LARGYTGKKSSNIVPIVISLAVVGAIGYGVSLYSFESEDPTIKSSHNKYWNRVSPITIDIADNEDLESYEISVSDGQKEVITNAQTFLKPTKKQTISFVYPQQPINGVLLNQEATKIEVKIKAKDKSKWNFFMGNSASLELALTVDTIPPEATVLTHSYSITKGGSALVIFQAKDDNMRDLYIEANGNKFYPQPYKKAGYYATLIAWQHNKPDFKATLVAKDEASNQKEIMIDFYPITRDYRVSWIEATDKFIDGKISELASSETSLRNRTERLDKLKAVNETLRDGNEALIHNASKAVSKDILQSWSITPFYPLVNGQKVADFGDDRHYYYKDKTKEVSHSLHVGIDLASNQNAPIIASNGGKVVMDKLNGIYGNMPMIDHGLGLYTLYGHCSSIAVKNGDIIKKGDIIAKSGMTGLALGDHLHFGVLVQGVEVRPEEWMDQHWLNDNVYKVFTQADGVIR